MRTRIAILLIACAMTSFAQKKVKLFNGKDLNGWTIWVANKSVKPADFFYVKNGVIETPGVPAGYLRTTKEFENYKLHVEWCYPEKPTNSGVFIHTVGPDQQWPTHYQAQLKYGSAGDFITQGVGVKATVRDTAYVSTEKVKPIAAKMKPSNEKPAGEGQWNSFDITCKGNTIEIKVNGVVQNYATNCSVTKGAIGLQAEGSKIQFRNIWIQPLKK